MSSQNFWSVYHTRKVLDRVCPLIPTQKWSRIAQTNKVLVSTYRAYQVPSRSFSRTGQIVADFPQVRAVYLSWDAPYFKTDQNIVENQDGTIRFEPHPFYVHSTGEGVLLLLITPLPDNYGDDNADESTAKERVRSVRSTMVSLMGRNAAYKHEFDVTVECDERIVGRSAPTFATPENEIPLVTNDGIGIVNLALTKLYSFSVPEQDRIRLALRWYQRSLGDDLFVRDTEEGKIDSFINSWLALETLLMEGTTNISPIIGLLTDLHELDRQQAGELFPIGRIFGLRGEIIHTGRMASINSSLMKFMNDLFADALLRCVGLSSGQYTSKYLDGSARELI